MPRLYPGGVRSEVKIQETKTGEKIRIVFHIGRTSEAKMVSEREVHMESRTRGSGVTRVCRIGRRRRCRVSRTRRFQRGATNTIPM